MGDKEKRSVFGFVLGWVTGHKGETKQAEDAMHETGVRLGRAFMAGVAAGVTEGRDQTMTPAIAVESAPVNRIAATNGKAPRAKRKAAKK